MHIKNIVEAFSKENFKMTFKGRSRVREADIRRKRIPERTDTHKVRISKGRGAGRENTEVKSRGATTSFGRRECDKLRDVERYLVF